MTAIGVVETVSIPLGVLAGDPRPRYQEDPQRVYGMGFAGQNVRFTVAGDTLTVRSIDPLEK